MKNFKNCLILAVLTAVSAVAQQNTLVQTALSAAITANQSSIQVANATGINAPSFSSGLAGSKLFVVDIGQTKGELMQVTSVSGTTIGVSRTAGGKGTTHASGAMVLVATLPNWFFSTDPAGSCTGSATFVTPWLNTVNGKQWVCSSVTGSWVPGWGNRDAPPAPTVLVASVAGTTAVNSPLQHVNGTNAITAWQPTVGWNGDGFCIIPDAAFTTTTGGTTVASTRVTAIAIASTAVANKTLCFTYDATNAKFTASY